MTLNFNNFPISSEEQLVITVIQREGPDTARCLPSVSGE